MEEIISEYQIGTDKIELVFEGTDDEFWEIQELCKGEKYRESISLSRSDAYLENARDILMDINSLFNEKLHPLIMRSVDDFEKIKTELAKYMDAASDVIPICVLGNYSAGKSTFINALIGNEILPSGAEPVTAKTYKIQYSDFCDKASICFTYGEQPVKFKIEGSTFFFEGKDGENDLILKLTEEFEKLENPSLTALVNLALEILNGDKKNFRDKISDLIEVRVPFVSGLWGESSAHFVILDTPGSNSVLNKEHLAVLKNAISGLSNGLLIFVTEFDSLDSGDNEKLFMELEKMEELDSRFSMIVINKADATELDKDGFSEEKEKKILEETIPKNLNSSGIYFVSSVMGLGSKNNGEFIDTHYAELYDEKQEKYSDTTSRFYKSLYKYNIMSKQLKTKSVETAAANPDLIYANCGLFTVEKEIQTFAGRYSAYNKCWQAQRFLGKVIDITSTEIEKTKEEREKKRKDQEEHLRKEERELIDKIASTGRKFQERFEKEYYRFMKNIRESVRSEAAATQLKEQQIEIEKKIQEAQAYAERNEEVKESVGKLFGHFGDNVKNAVIKRDINAVKSVGMDLNKDAVGMLDAYNVLNKVGKDIDKAAAKEMLETVMEEFKQCFQNAQERMDSESKNYWEEKALALKKLLVEIVSGTSVLSVEKRNELADIIIKYGNIAFDNHPEEVFLNEDFRRKFKIFNLEIFSTDKLDIDKLAKTYNSEMAANTDKMCVTIQKSHKDSFINWKESLIETVTVKIVDYSPSLHDQAQIIKEETAKINELETRQIQLKFYSDSIKTMMDWKAVKAD